jgi:hypothetical protein
MRNPVEFGFKRKDAAGHTEQRDENSRDNPDGKVNVQNQLAHNRSILRGLWEGYYSRPTPSESATRLM